MLPGTQRGGALFDKLPADNEPNNPADALPVGARKLRTTADDGAQLAPSEIIAQLAPGEYVAACYARTSGAFRALTIESERDIMRANVFLLTEKWFHLSFWACPENDEKGPEISAENPPAGQGDNSGSDANAQLRAAGG